MNSMLPSRLEEIMKEKRLSAIRLSEMTGINRGSISRYLQGTVEPKASKIHLLAKALKVSEAWLMGFTDEREEPKPVGVQMIPVFSCLSCGSGTWVDEQPESSVCVPDYMTDPAVEYFANPAEGDSMYPGIRNGDLLIFEKCEDIDLGKVGSFSLNGEYYCKRLRKDDKGFYLESDNPSYDDIRIWPEDNFRVIGLYKIKISKEQ